MARTGDPKKETAAARKARERAKKMSEDQVMASTSFNPPPRKRKKVSVGTNRSASIIKEGKARTEKQKYRSEKDFSRRSERNISDKRAARLKKRFDKETAESLRKEGSAKRVRGGTTPIKGGYTTRRRKATVRIGSDGNSTLVRERSRLKTKYVDRDRAKSLEKKYKKKQKPDMAAKGLKIPSEDQVGLKKLPRDVRNKMGYAKNGMKYSTGGKKPAEDKYTTSDGRQLSKSSIREAAIKKIRKAAASKAAKAHKKGVKRGRKIVGTRKGPGDPRMLTQANLPVYKREKKIKERGEKKVQKYIDKQARKYAPKPKKQRTPRGGGGIPKPGKTVNYAEQSRKRDKIRNFLRKCAGNTCAQKQRRAGGAGWTK